MLADEVAELVAEHGLRLRRRESIHERRRHHDEGRPTAQGQRVCVRGRGSLLTNNSGSGFEPAEARDGLLEARVELGILPLGDLDARREVVQARHLFERRRNARSHRSLEKPQRRALHGGRHVLVERVTEGLSLELRELDARRWRLSGRRQRAGCGHARGGE